MSTLKNYVDSCVEKFVKYIYVVKQKVPTVEKKNLILVIPFLD